MGYAISVPSIKDTKKFPNPPIITVKKTITNACLAINELNT
jgi:hypothetical protein